jgi:hypothetical protein
LRRSLGLLSDLRKQHSMTGGVRGESVECRRAI